MNSVLLRGLDKAEAAERKQILKNSKIVLDIVQEVLYNVYMDTVSSSRSDYSNPNWPYLKANQEGRQEVLQSLVEIFSQSPRDPSENLQRKALTECHKKTSPPQPQ